MAKKKQTNVKRTVRSPASTRSAITIYKRAEKALEESERRYRELFEKASMAIFQSTLDGKVIAVNLEFARMFGYASPEEVAARVKDVGADIFADPRRRAEIIRLRAEHPDLNEFESFYRRKDGSTFLGKLHLRSVLDSVGRMLYFEGFIEDITQRKRVEEELQESEQRMREIVDNAPFGAHLYELEPERRLVFIGANRAADSILGVNNQQFVGKTIEEAFPLLNQTDIPDAYRRVAATGERYDVEQVDYADGGIRGAFEVHAFQSGPNRMAAFFRDITERKRAEETLRTSAARFRALIENATDMVRVLDPSGVTVYVSPSIKRIMGYEPEEMLGRSPFELIHPEDLARAREVWEAGFQAPAQALRAIEMRIHHADGTWHIHEVIGTNLLNEPSVRGVVTNTRDITERKRAEEALRESERHLRSVITAAPIALWDLDSAGIILLSEGNALAQLGLKAGELVGQSVFEFNKDDLEALALIRRGLAGEEFSAQVQVGSRHWSNHYVPRRDENGNVIGLVGVSVDITERKRAEEALSQERNLLRTLIDHLPDSVWVKDTESRFVMGNLGVTRHLGATTPEEIIGKSDFDFHPKDLAEEYYAAEQQVFRSGEPLLNHEEIVEDQTTGKSIWNLSTKVPLRNTEGNIVGIVGIGHDITERKRAEETLRQRLAELEAVHTVSAALRIAQTLDEALPIVLDQTLASLETDAGTIWLYHTESDELRVAVNRGWFSQLDETPMRPGEGIAGTVFASGHAHLAPEFVRDPLARPVTKGEIPAGWGGACIPIRTGAETVGVLFVSVPLPRQITPEQMKLLDSLAEMAGTALHRMRLNEETVRHLKYFQALHEIDRVISASFDLRMTLNVLTDHVITQLGVDAADVLLLNPYLQTLEYAAGHGFRTRAIQDTHLRLGESFAGRVALERRTILTQDPPTTRESSSFVTLWAGEGFVTYCGVPLIVKGEVKGVLEIFCRTPLSQSGEKSEWLDSLETFAAQAAIAIDNIQLFENLQRSNQELAIAYDTTIEGWSRALEVRDRETQGHTVRVAEMTIRLAQRLHLNEAEIVHIRRGALLHDIGKMGVPDTILLNPDKLTDEEWAIMRQHPQQAYEILRPIEFLRPALDIPYCHHEKWNGTGYPRRLKGDQIPLAARLFAIVDVYDALTSDRPYRPAWSRDKAMEYIRQQSGEHFDPQIVALFLREIAGK